MSAAPNEPVYSPPAIRYPGNRKPRTYDRKKIRTLAVEEMRKLHARGAPAQDAAAAAIEEAARLSFPSLDRRGIWKIMNKNAPATLFEALAACSQPTKKSVASLVRLGYCGRRAAGPVACCPQPTPGDGRPAGRRAPDGSSGNDDGDGDSPSDVADHPLNLLLPFFQTAFRGKGGDNRVIY